jgi:ATP/ADP translocase
LLALMGLFFLVICAVGILRPIKNVLALDGLGGTNFYKTYLVSAVVILFVPIYSRLADHFSWRTMIPVAAAFFAVNLVVFRIIYVPGSAAFGLIFYGWYDLFAAALVAQFFMATQLFLNARSAKQAYPLVIAGGSLGATFGSMFTGFFAQRLGTPNLLLVAAGIIMIFAVGLPIVLTGEVTARPRKADDTGQSNVRALVRNRHVRMIALAVLVTIVVKQLVDYQFNVLTAEVFETRDAMAAFQGKFNAATQWLPLVVVMVLQPLLLRWGVGLAVMLLPVFMLVTNAAVAISWSIAAAATAKGTENALRYAAERAGREILYVPVPHEIKLKAKAYIDIAIEKGFGKAFSALLIFGLLQVMPAHRLAWVSVGLSAAWMLLAVAVRREYVRAVAKAIEGRFASLRGVFASLLDASTLPTVRTALRSGDSLQVAFATDLIEQAPHSELLPFKSELHALLDHPSDAMRERALVLLARHPEALDANRILAVLDDPAPRVREAAVKALASGVQDRVRVLEELLAHPKSHVRAAVLASLAEGGLSDAQRMQLSQHHLAQLRCTVGTREARIETALAASSMGAEGARVVRPLLDDPDTDVVIAALRSARTLAAPELLPACVRALRQPATREAARGALVAQGEGAIDTLAASLLDDTVDPVVRRTIPSVLARIPADTTVRILLRCIAARETDQLLDFRALKALGKLRSQAPQLRFDERAVCEVLVREIAAARAYADARAALRGSGVATPGVALLEQALLEAWSERRESSFRCLGLIHPPHEVRHAYLAIAGGDTRTHANALEWLEQGVGHETYRVLAPVLADPEQRAAVRASPDQGAMLDRLRTDEDAWIAACAAYASRELEIHQTIDRDTGRMEIIERVFLLQRVDLLQDARSAHLALLASIAEETDEAPDTVLIEPGAPSPALYIVMRGAVELRGVGDQLLTARAGFAFGTWALIDEAPSIISARVSEPSRLLRINRSDFHDLLADHPELALGLLQGLARRFRTLVA